LIPVGIKPYYPILSMLITCPNYNPQETIELYQPNLGMKYTVSFVGSGR